MEYKLDDLTCVFLSKKLRIKGPTNVETVGHRRFLGMAAKKMINILQPSYT